MDRKDEEEIMEDSKVKVTEPVNEQAMGSWDKDFSILELDPFDDDN